jgi:hypothetical protein
MADDRDLEHLIYDGMGTRSDDGTKIIGSVRPTGSVLDGVQDIGLRKIVEAMIDAGFNVTAVLSDDDVEVDDGKDVLNFTVQEDKTVTWHDFSHTTRIGNVDNHAELVAAFTELLPLSDDPLQRWIESRKYGEMVDVQHCPTCDVVVYPGEGCSCGRFLPS